MQDQGNNMLGNYGLGSGPEYEYVWAGGGTIVIPREPLDTLHFRRQQAVLEAQEVMKRFAQQQQQQPMPTTPPT